MNRGRVSTQVFLIFLMMMFLMFTIGCSKSDDTPAAPPAAGSTISGIAAAGAALIGTVTIKDSSSPAIEKVTTIATDGSYSFDVSGMTAPFAFRADGNVGGREYHLYSAAVSADINGTINITPFTDLIIANMAADIAANYYDSGNFSGLTPDALAAAETALQAKLQPILTALGVDAAIDLLRTSFNTDHTGLDAVIDVVKVTVDPATVEATLTNVVNGSTVTVNIAAGGTSTGALTDTGVANGVTALQAITATWNTFASLFATSLPSASNATLLSLIANDATFMESGEDRDSWLTDITSDPTMIGISITSVVLISIDEAAGTAQITFTGTQGGKIMHGPDGDICNMVKQGGTWRYAGNGWIARAQVRAEARYSPYNSGTKIDTGLRLNIEANYPAGAAVQSAVVTGPGLPGGGVILNKQISNEWFAISGGNSDGDNLYHDMTDGNIGIIPENAEYTIVLKSAAGGGGSILATYKDTILKRPLKNSELSAASFPSITTPTVATLRAFNGGSLPVTWTLPTGLSSNWVELVLNDSGVTNSASVEVQLSATDTSKTVTITVPVWAVANRFIYLNATDAYDRRFQIGIW